MSGYPFNEDEIDLVVDLNGKVPVSASYLKLLLPENLGTRKDPVSSGLFLWNITENDWEDETLKDVRVVFDYPADDFEAIPELFATWITARAAVEHWQETNQSDASWLREREQLAECAAINSLPPMTIHNATGYAGIRSINTGTPPFAGLNRAWVVVS